MKKIILVLLYFVTAIVIGIITASILVFKMNTSINNKVLQYQLNYNNQIEFYKSEYKVSNEVNKKFADYLSKVLDRYDDFKIQIEDLEYKSLQQDIKKALDEEEKKYPLRRFDNCFTFLVLGVDSRSNSKSGNTDVQMIVNVNLDTAEIQVVSIYRDMYVKNIVNNEMIKLNAVYGKYGIDTALQTFNKTFDLDIDSYVIVNWKDVSNIIDELGGVDIEITPEEFIYINAFIHETCLSTGIGSENPAQYYISSPGNHHLNGIQATAYGRLRLPDSDFKRTERQHEVAFKCFDIVKNTNARTVTSIATKLLSSIKCNISIDNIYQLIQLVGMYNIKDVEGFPLRGYRYSITTDTYGYVIISKSLTYNVVKLHEILFNDDTYECSDFIKKLSEDLLKLH